MNENVDTMRNLVLVKRNLYWKVFFFLFPDALDCYKFNNTESTAVTDTRESPDKIDATYSEAAKKFVIWRHVDVKTIFIGRRTDRWPTTLFEFVPIKWIC